MHIKHYSKLLHDELGAGMVYVAPLLAPLPSAWAIWQATGSPVLAAAVEGLGFSATSVALRTHSARQKGAAVPFRLALALCIVYGVAVLAVLLGKEFLPIWADYRTGVATLGELVAAAGTLTYPLLTAVGAGVYALTEQLDAIDQDTAQAESQAQATAAAQAEMAQEEQAVELERRRLEMQMELEQKALDAEAKREERWLKLSAKLSGDLSTPVRKDKDKDAPTSGGQPSGTPSTDALLDIWRDNPYASLRTVAKEIGMSKSWVSDRKKEMEADGLISVNGHVEVR